MLSALYFGRAMLMTILAAAFLYQLIESRFDFKRTWAIVGGGVSAVMIANLALFLLLGPLVYIRLTPLLLNLPVCLIFVWISRHRGFRVVFTLMTHFAVVYTVTLAGILCALPFAGHLAADMAGRLLMAVLFLLLFRHLRPLYLSMQEILEHGWALFCLIPLAYYGTCYFYIMRVPPSQRGENLSVQCFLAIIVALAYTVIFFFFHQTRQYAEHENERQRLKMAVAALQKQSETLIEGERRLSTLRHDIRHYIHNIAALAREGETGEILKVTDQFDESVLRARGRHWCNNRAINAAFAYYLGSVEAEHIEVESRLDLPEDLPVDRIELSIVIANLIENAINACCKQPEGEARRVVLNATTSPQLAIEIANTYGGEVQFGRDGLPLSSEKGHGMGVRSVLFFARRHGATCTFSVKDGMFHARLMMLPQKRPAPVGEKGNNDVKTE